MDKISIALTLKMLRIDLGIIEDRLETLGDEDSTIAVRCANRHVDALQKELI